MNVVQIFTFASSLDKSIQLYFYLLHPRVYSLKEISAMKVELELIYGTYILPTAVHYGRLPPSKRKLAREDGDFSPDSKLYEMVEVIVRVSAAYHVHFNTTHDKVAHIRRKKYSLVLFC